MTRTSIAEVKCEKCKTVYEAEVVDHVDLSEDREIVKALKTGKANRVQCSKCKKVMYLEKRSIVINFDPESLIVMYDPKARTKAQKEEIMQDYHNVITFNEILQEVGEETEFQVISNLSKLKELLEVYTKAHS
ncbi:MAG: CpXC domain-containing protein [Candidatus Thorarchaeota archaeon]